ncbi:hypothetical protein GEMRC1_004938 [Eukaryota sp. GEM-RC1]
MHSIIGNSDAFIRYKTNPGNRSLVIHNNYADRMSSDGDISLKSLPYQLNRKVVAYGGYATQPVLVKRSAYEQYGYDPKAAELCLSRMKPGEILVEVRSDVDVQITRRIWV